MPTIIDSLVVTLGLDSSGFKKGQKDVGKGLKDTKDNADQTAKDMEAAGKRAASFFGSIRSEIVALAGVSLSLIGVKNFVTGMTENLTKLSVTSKALDLSPKQLEGWTGAAEAVGSSTEKVTGILGNFQKLVNDFRGGGDISNNPLVKILGGISGVTGEKFDFRTMSGADILQKVIDNWGKLSKDAQRKVGADIGADDALIQSWAEKGDQSFGNLRKEFENQSKATDSLGNDARKLNIQLVLLKRNFEAAGQSLFTAMLPYVKEIPPVLMKISDWISSHGPDIAKFFSNSEDEVNKVVDVVGGWQNALAILAAFVAGSWALKMLTGISRVAKGFGPIIAAMAAISAWDKLGGEEKDAKEKGVSVGENLINKKNQKEKENQQSGDTPTAKIIAWWEKITGKYDGDTKYTAYGTQQQKSPGVWPPSEDLRGEGRQAQNEANRLLDGILNGIKKLNSALTEQDHPSENIQEQAGYLMRDRPALPAEAPKPTKAGSALLGWMQPKLDALEKAFNLPLGLLRSVATTESAGNPYAVSGAGAKGLFQFMDGTAKDMGLKGNDVFDPMKSAEAAAKYLSQLLRQNGGDLSKALASYNWGIGNVQRKGLENAPAETQAYVPKVLAGIKVGASANANVVNSQQQQPSNKTDIHIGEMTVQSNASSIKALGDDVHASTKRNGLVMAYSTGQ